MSREEQKACAAGECVFGLSEEQAKETCACRNPVLEPEPPYFLACAYPLAAAIGLRAEQERPETTPAQRKAIDVACAQLSRVWLTLHEAGFRYHEEPAGREEPGKMSQEERCHRCEGCGQVANSDDEEPWTRWASLPPGSDLAVKMGIVKPKPCPRCFGAGRLEPAQVKEGHAWSIVDKCWVPVENVAEAVRASYRTDKPLSAVREASG